MNPIAKIFLVVAFGELLIASGVDLITGAILYILFCLFVQLNATFEILRDRRPNVAWRSRYSRRRLF